ncbi:MAG: hypothetical protein R2712_11515 [Vicinamibacterales bacterium]
MPSATAPPPPAAANGTPGRLEATTAAPGMGWHHPRDTHQARHTRRVRVRASSGGQARAAARQAPGLSAQAMALTFTRWGIRTLGALAALPRPELHERLGDQGLAWQRLASGDDEGPLVPWLAEPVFEETLELEWPVEGFEPLSFVLARVFDPLAVALERADRGAVAIRTALHLTTRAVHVRVLPLPAPMRDPKTLRTLVLLDLESHPPAAAVDRVQVRLEPTPGRILQWTLFDRARPAPEQVATLIARLTALAGEGHVGAPALVDSWRPGVFTVEEFGKGAEVQGVGAGLPDAGAGNRAPRADAECTVPQAFRRFRLPVPVRVRVEDGRPVRITTDRQGLTGGSVVQAAGPWRTSGEWWAGEVEERGQPCREEAGHARAWAESAREDRQGRHSEPEPASGRISSAHQTPESRQDAALSREGPSPSRRDASHVLPPWDRDEWDIAMTDGTIYRLFVERSVGQWFLEGIVD